MFERAVCACVVAILICVFADVHADPAPDDVYYEIVCFTTNYAFGWLIGGKGYRIGSHDYHPEISFPFGVHRPPDVVLANHPVDLTNVVKIEATALQCKVVATAGLQIAVNGHEWLSFPGPGIADWYSYNHAYFPTVVIPLSHVEEGSESMFKLKVARADSDVMDVRGIVFRFYLDKEKTAHPTGRIISPASGEKLGFTVDLRAEAASPNGEVARVDYIGYYEDFDYGGTGVYRDWHYHHDKAFLVHNIASIPGYTPVDRTEPCIPPYQQTWSTEWIPDQSQPMKLMARITDEAGIMYHTEEVENLTFDRPGYSVKLCKTTSCPKKWGSRTGGTGTISIAADPQAASEAMLVAATWNGRDHSYWKVNGTKLNYHLFFEGGHSYGVNRNPLKPLSVLKTGNNSISVHGNTEHGCDVLYPGPSILLKYGDYETGCRRAVTARASVAGGQVRHTGRVATITGTAGVTVDIIDAAGRVLRSRTLGADGSLSVTGLRPGLYLVRFGTTGTALPLAVRPAD